MVLNGANFPWILPWDLDPGLFSAAQNDKAECFCPDIDGDDKPCRADILRGMPAPSIDTILSRLAIAGACGGVLIIGGRIGGIQLAGDIGAALLAPITLITAGACLLVVLLAPAWPLSAVAPRVPRLLRWPFILASVAVVVLWWWCVWACVTAGPGPGY